MWNAKKYEKNLLVKTGSGTLNGKGRYVSDVADEQEMKSVDNRKEFLNGGGQVMYGPEFLTVFNGETGIEDITTEEIANTEETSANGIYDFSGRKVNRQTPKGVYIQNGKKVIFLLAR